MGMKIISLHPQNKLQAIKAQIIAALPQRQAVNKPFSTRFLGNNPALQNHIAGMIA